jgi:hypothetical protein
MNERIRELSEQASKWVCENEPRALDDTDLFYEWMQAKFAELIVQECARIASNTNLEDVDGGDSAVLGAAREQILEHFGVEE